MSAAPASRSSAATITHVEIEAPADGLLGAHIDYPVPGTALSSFALELRGWAIGADAPVTAIEVALGARKATLKATTGEPRPDVAVEFPEVSHAQSSGFKTTVGLLENRARFGLEVHARLSDGARVRIGRVEGERRRLSSGFTSTIQPLMLSTIGRSGSTWLAGVLSSHPEVIGYRPMQFESRVATYWTSVLQGLAQPRSYLSQLVTTDLESDRRWWLGDGARSTPKIDDPPLEEWLGADAIEEMAAMCQSRIDAFFRRLAVDRGKSGARFFLEKFLLEPVALDLLAELYPETREIILVRDFRDVASSVLAFNRKRGFQAFGREHVDSDVEYIRSVVAAQAVGILQRWEESKGQAHLVRYEDLLTEPEATLQGACEFVGIDSSSDTVRQTFEWAKSEAPDMNHHRTSDPAETIGRWRNDLSDELISVCMESLHPVLEAFGYDLSRTSPAAALGT